MKTLSRWISALLLALCLAHPIAHAKRVALVIGNDNYQFTEKLVNAGNDANAMAQALQAAGFAVTRYRDLPRERLFKAVDSFVQGVAKDDEVVVFFSGHGVQIEAAPYLLPTDIKADTARQVTRDGLALDALVGDLSKARFTLVVVDACRNNPFAVRGQRSLGADRGLQPIEPPEGTAIIFSAGRGQAALDTLGQNDNARQGVFTREFLKQMTAPGLQVRDLLLKVRDSVEQQAASVNHKQRPALIDETRGFFYFYPPGASTAAGARAGLVTPVSEALAIEIAYWNSLQESGGVQELQLYLRRYPHGQFADLAQARLARLTVAPGVPAPAAAVPPAALAADPRPAGEGDSEAQRLRALAQKGNAAAMGRLAFLYRTGRNGLVKDEAQALHWFRQGAEAGNGAAMAGLGFMHESAMGGLARDPAQALAWYRKGAETGDGHAMNNLGNLYASGRGGLAKDDVQAVAWYRRAVDAGNAWGMVNLGAMYDAGRGGLPRDEAQALAWIRRGVEAGNGQAMAMLGFRYETGRAGLARDPVQAVDWYRKGVAAGDGQAMNNLAAAYANGRGVANDDAQAVAWYRRAIEAGNTRAMANLGWLHETGRGGLARDEREALAWYRRGAEAGNGYAMALLGFRYESGRAGLAKDDVQALAWYRKGVEAGDALAMNNLGGFYASGRGGLARDEAEALAWYRKAAALGEGFAMNNLGLWYASGRGGLPQDTALARQWYERAVAVGNEPAKTNLAKLP